MHNQEGFFEPDHERLLTIATWAKYLAWPMFVVYVLWTIAVVIEFQNAENYAAAVRNRPSQDLIGLLMDSPLKAFDLVVNMSSILLRCVVYCLFLK